MTPAHTPGPDDADGASSNAREPGAAGERTIQWANLNDAMFERFEAFVFWRAESARALRKKPPSKQATSDFIIKTFLQNYPMGPGMQLPAILSNEKRRAITMSSSRMAKVRALAELKDVQLSVMIRWIFVDFLERYAPQEWVDLRRRIGDIATTLVEASPGTPSEAITLPKPKKQGRSR
jgi:hypothetical protein